MKKKLSDQKMARLIEFVKCNTSLYDPSVKDYTDAAKNTRKWDAIGEIIEISGTSAKKLWRSKRDRFRRMKRTEDTTGENKWKWYKAVEFITPYLDDITFFNTSLLMSSTSPTTLASIPTKSEPITFDSTMPYDSFTSESITLASTPHSNSTSEATHLASGISYSPSMREAGQVRMSEKRKQDQKANDERTRIEDPSDEAIVDMYKERQRSPKKSQPEDSDELFMKSCLLNLKELPKQQRSEVKIEIMKVIYQKQYQLPPRLVQPLPSP